MPIYERSYLRWDGHVLEHPRTWLVIARTGVRLVWRRILAVLLFVALIPFILRAGQIYLVSKFGEASFLADLADSIRIDPGFFMNFIKDQSFLLLLITCVCGAGLIAGDRKLNALPLYFSRPVDFGDYVSGKFLVLLFYGGLITVVPGLLLFATHALLTSEMGFFATHFYLPLSIVSSGAVAVTVMGALMLAISAAARGTRSAVIAIFAVVYIPDLLARLLSSTRDVGWISITNNIQQVEALLFGLPNPHRYHAVAGISALALVLASCFWALRLRIRPTEVVK